MPGIQRLLAKVRDVLGNQQAIQNARMLLEDRRREDLTVAVLVSRLDLPAATVEAA